MRVCLYSCLSYKARKSHLFLHRINLSSVACMAQLYVPTLFKKGMFFGQKITEHKTCILIFSANFVCNSTPSKTNSSRHYPKFTSVFM